MERVRPDSTWCQGRPHRGCGGSRRALAPARIDGFRGPVLGVALGVFCAANWLWEIHLQAPIYSQYGFAVDDSAVRAALEKEGLYTANGVPPRVSYLPTMSAKTPG